MATDNNNKVLNVPNLRFPEFTEEWKETKIGDITSKVGSGVTPKGGSAVYKTSGHLFIRSQNVGNGCFLLDDVAYIDEATHKKQINTELKDGDVLLNITGASIGRTTVVNKNVEGGNVNQHVCIIRLLEDYSPNYICNYLLSYGGQKQIDSFQTGGNREGLNFEQIRSIKFFIPSFREQSKIASLLSLLEERIATQNKIIEDLKKLKVAIRDKQLNTIRKHYGLNYQICDLLDYEQPTKYVVTDTEYSEDRSKTPVLTANKAFILGYTDESFGVYDKGACIILDDFTLDCKYVDFPFKVKSSAIKILTVKNGYSLRYVYEYLNYLNLETTEHKRHYISEIEPMMIAYPTDKKKIDDFNNMMSSLESKIEIENKYLQSLLAQKSYLLSNMFI